MKNHYFLDLISNNKTPTQITNTTSISHNIYNYTNIPQPQPQPALGNSYSEESDSNSPSLTSSTDNIFPFSGAKRTLSELSNSEQDSPANKEPALLFNQEQTQPHRLSSHFIIHPASQNPAPELRTQNIVDLTGEDTGGHNAYPKPNFGALTHAPANRPSANPIHNITIASSPTKNGITTKITISSSTEFPNSERQAITQYCKQEATQINQNITNSAATSQTAFVDPTYDAAFKYLFSQLELAQSFISSLLELQCKITSLKPINVHLSELQQENPSNENQASLAVDGLFKIKTNSPQDNKMLVFLEMQRKSFPGFLTREQIYSALIATNAIKKGVSKHYDKIPKIIGIIIALKNILPKEVPYCSQISTKVQSKDGELINIKFSSLTDMRIFELEKFRSHPDRLIVNKYSSSSLQWLDFLLKCGQVKSIPENTSDIITKAYNHMTRNTMTSKDLALIEAAQIKTKLEEQARNQELIDTAHRAELKGKAVSAIEIILNLSKIPSICENIIAQAVAGQFNNVEVDNIVNYIKTQPRTLNAEDIIEALNLLGDNIEGDEYENFLSGSTNAELPE